MCVFWGRGQVNGLIRENKSRVRGPAKNQGGEGPGVGTKGQEGCSDRPVSESRRKCLKGSKSKARALGRS